MTNDRHDLKTIRKIFVEFFIRTHWALLYFPSLLYCHSENDYYYNLSEGKQIWKPNCSIKLYLHACEKQRNRLSTSQKNIAANQCSKFWRTWIIFHSILCRELVGEIAITLLITYSLFWLTCSPQNHGLLDAWIIWFPKKLLYLYDCLKIVMTFSHQLGMDSPHN